MRVVIAEDEVLLREGLSHLLENDGMTVVAAVGTGAQLEREVARHLPDLAITDIRMPPTYTDEGLVSALRIRHAHPGIGVGPVGVRRARVGELDAGVVAIAGPGGVASFAGSGTRVSWWVGAEDRWHRPEAEPSTRDRLVDGCLRRGKVLCRNAGARSLHMLPHLSLRRLDRIPQRFELRD